MSFTAQKNGGITKMEQKKKTHRKKHINFST